STDPAKIARPKIRRILSESPALRARIEQSRAESANGVTFTPEHQCVCSIVCKLAQGHALFELHDPHPERPDTIHVAPLGLMSRAERDAFESTQGHLISVWPEVGSRAMQHIVVGIDAPPENPWLIVQSGLYRFH